MQAQRFSAGHDPVAWCAGLALAFLGLTWWRLGIPSQIYFDELHYVPAARKLIAGLRANPEHPLFGKTVIAAAIAGLGDQPRNWRVPSALFGGLGLFALMRLVWFSSGQRHAAIFAGLLLASDFLWFIQSRIAMLDMIMAGLGLTALWQFTAACRLPGQARWRLALAGVLLGLALGTKWSIAPATVLPGLAFVVLRIKAHGGRCLLARAGAPIAGISLAEAALWLGLVPLGVYWLSFWPAFVWTPDPVNPWHPLEWHGYMRKLQDSVVKLHPYRSVWYQWVVDWRAVWYLYKAVDGAQRGVVLIGNPLTMLAGLAALAWTFYEGVRRRRADLLGFFALYAASLGLWIISGKPIQFYYHYLLPSTFMMGALALALDGLWQREDRWRWITPAILVLSLALFAWFYPIISAAPLCCGRPSYAYWMWLPTWR